MPRVLIESTLLLSSSTLQAGTHHWILNETLETLPCVEPPSSKARQRHGAVAAATVHTTSGGLYI